MRPDLLLSRASARLIHHTAARPSCAWTVLRGGGRGGVCANFMLSATVRGPEANCRPPAPGRAIGSICASRSNAGASCESGGTREEVAVDNCLGTSTSLWPLCCEWSGNISNARVGVHCEERVLGVRAELDQRDIGPPSRGHRPDLLDIHLARDHLVSEPGRDLGEQLEPIPLLVGDQHPTDAGSRVLSHRPKMQPAVHSGLLRGNEARLLFAAPQRNRCRERLRGVRKQPAPRKDPPSRGRPEQGADVGALVELELARGGSETASDVQQATGAPAGSDGRPPPLSPNRPSTCQVSDDRGSGEVRFTRETVAELLAAEAFFWLDLDCPTAADFDVLREAFGFHPLAVEDSEHFEQRAKIDDYDDFVFLVVYGAAAEGDRLVEVHCFYSERFLVTVHRDDCPAFAEIRRRYQQRGEAIDRPSLLLYRIVDGLVDSFFPILAEFDDRIDELENSIFLQASDAQLQEIFQMKRLLVGMRKAVTPQRDSFASMRGGIAQLPGLAEEDEHYFRDVYDHLIRISDLIDSYRDLLTSAMDVYLSTVSNRLNAVMKQLAVIATIFLPLSWLTGFFGQNFGWLTGHIGHWQAFVGVGVGTELAALAILLAFFKRRGWF